METFLLLHFMFLWAQNEFCFYAVAIPTSSPKSPLHIKDGESLNMTCVVDTVVSQVIWNRNGIDVLTITDTTSCSSTKASSLDTYTYSVTCDQQKRFSMSKYGLNRSDDNTIWSCQAFDLSYNDLGTSSGVRVYIYKFPSSLSIVGDSNRTLYDGDNVTLSVSTGCINPSDSAHYNVTWKYVEANNTTEKSFDIIMQNVSSIGGCTNTYEDNLKFNLIVTNAMNTGNTDLNISQVKMTFTMAGTDFNATKNVSYTLKTKVPTTTTTVPPPPTTGTTTSVSATSTTFISSPSTITNASTTSTSSPSTITNASTTSTSSPSTITNASTTSTSSPSTITNASTTSTSSPSTITNASSKSTSIYPTPAQTNATTKSATGINVSKKMASDTDIKVIVPAVVVPCGLLIIGAIILLVVCCVRRGKNVPESPDGNKKDKQKWTLGHTDVTDNHNAVYTTPDGFIIYPGPAARSTARSYKDKKLHPVTDQYSRSDLRTYHHQADYAPSTYTSTDTHKGKHRVTDQYSGPNTEAYGHQTAYLNSTHKSARTYERKAKNYDMERHQQVFHHMTTSRPAKYPTSYYPQMEYYEHLSHDVDYSGGGQYVYGHRSRSHHNYKGGKQHIENYSPYEMADYRGYRAGDRATKQDTAFYY